MFRKIIVSLFICISTLGLILSPVKADGIIIPDPDPIMLDEDFYRLNQLSILYHHVDVEINSQIAVTHVDQVFYNPNDWEVEGQYIFPLPEGAVVNEFTLWIDGKPVEGKILEADEARKIYEEIVREMQDPALLEYIGKGAFQASIYPIPPQGESRIELEYQQVLNSDNGLVEYIYPLNTEKFSVYPLDEVRISVNIQSNEDIRAVYSPTHPLDINREDEKTVSASYEEYNVTPDQDFGLYYSIGESEALHLFTYRDPNNSTDQDGFFMLMLAPPITQPENNIPKDMLLVLDRSGSMEGEKFQQAMSAAKYILENLQPEDRFYLSTFSTYIDEFSSSLLPASYVKEAANQNALEWLDRHQASGSTNINLALLRAADIVDSERPTYLIFLTDGLPTEGVIESDLILNNFRENASSNIRLYSFGVGYDVDTYLLDSLSSENHGLTTYVQPGEQLDEALSTFYETISTPVLTNLSLDFGDISTFDIYPSPLPDLFAGNQIIILGRYKKGGSTNILLSGEINNQKREINFEDLTFARDNNAESQVMDNLPRLWATRKIGYLLKQIRIDGPDQETIDQIVNLSIRYGIVTPYTSYLVTEPMPLGAMNQRDLADEEFDTILAAPTVVSGQAAVEKAAEEAELADSDYVQSYNSKDGQIRNVWSRSFIYREGIWYDTAFDPDSMQPLPVEFLSSQYFELIEKGADIRAALALGERVILVLDGKAYETTNEKSESNGLLFPENSEEDTNNLEKEVSQPASQSDSSFIGNDIDNQQSNPGLVSTTKTETLILVSCAGLTGIITLSAFLLLKLRKQR